MPFKIDALIYAAAHNRYRAFGALHTAGGVIYSYSLPLAEVRDGKIVALPGLDERHSVTTSRHQNAVRPYVGKVC